MQSGGYAEDEFAERTHKEGYELVFVKGAVLCYRHMTVDDSLSLSRGKIEFRHFYKSFSVYSLIQLLVAKIGIAINLF